MSATDEECFLFNLAEENFAKHLACATAVKKLVSIRTSLFKSDIKSSHAVLLTFAQSLFWSKVLRPALFAFSPIRAPIFSVMPHSA